MIVYVETNFLLEIIYGQEEFVQANQILALVEEGRIDVRFPSFSLMEPLWTIRGRGRDRNSIHESLNKEVRQLGRSIYNADIVSLMKSLTDKIVTIEIEEMNKLEETYTRILQIATPIQISKEIYQNSLEYQKEYGLSPQDAIVFASIISDLQQQDKTPIKLFVSKNPKDFDQQEIKDELRTYNCKYIKTLTDSLSFIYSQIG